MTNSASWQKIFDDYEILKHDFSISPFPVKAIQIKKSCQDFRATNEKEVRLLCKHDTREDRPDVFCDNGLFLLPVRNGEYIIVQGEGYVDIPFICGDPIVHRSILDFDLESTQIGDSEMQHLDHAYASSLIRTFMGDPSLVLTIRGRKYTPKFDFYVGKQLINVTSVQTEVDAGYEGKNQIVLVEAKNKKSSNLIIRQLYYPFRQWQSTTSKKVKVLFFDMDKAREIYSIWQFEFTNPDDYNSIKLVKSSKYKIDGKDKHNLFNI